MNHSCDPNTVVRGREGIALREIAPWEAVTFNCNTTEYDMAEPFSCQRGSPRCQGAIRGFRYLTPVEREQLRPILSARLADLLTLDPRAHPMAMSA